MDELTQAQTLIGRTPLPNGDESLRAALDAGWPQRGPETPFHELFAHHVERARACASIAHEAASEHRWLARAFPALASEPPRHGVTSSSRGPLADFDQAAQSARQAVRSDPLWRAATLLQDRAHEGLVTLTLDERARCRAWIAHAEAPVREIAAERQRAATLHVAIERAEEGRALLGYVEAQNREAARLGAATEQPAVVLRVASEADRHVELQPLLTRRLGQSEFQVLRPLSGDPTLLVAYSRDLQQSPASSRTLRVRAPRSEPSTSRGVDR